MKTRIQTFFALVLVAGLGTLPLLLRPASVSASEQGRRLHVRKDCSQYTGLAGFFGPAGKRWTHSTTCDEARNYSVHIGLIR
jgi:hypothetical protein